MPSRSRVEEFIAMIQRGAFIESIDAFYAEDMTAQENEQAPRVGRAAQTANERATLAVMRVERSTAESFVVDGDRVAIHWTFEMRTEAGQRIRLSEIAYQTWRGDRILNERYFYDPAQRRPVEEPVVKRA